MSKSAPMPTSVMPGLMKFDCPWSFDERSDGSTRVAPGQRDAAAADERDRLADPEARVGAGELRVLEDRVEAVLLVVVRILVARSRSSAVPRTRIQSKSRDTSAAAKQALMLRRRLRELVVVVVAERAVQRRRGVPRAEVPVAVQAEVPRRRSSAARMSPSTAGRTWKPLSSRNSFAVSLLRL